MERFIHKKDVLGLKDGLEISDEAGKLIDPS